MKNHRKIPELTNEELEEYSLIATDSVLLMDDFFNSSDIKAQAEKADIINFAKELKSEMLKRVI
jgi:hypothetical protein